MKRALILAAVLLAPAAAQAFLMSADSVLRRVSAQRQDLKLSSMSVRGSFALHGASARTTAAALGLAETDSLTVPATVVYKVPGYCRVDLEPQGGQPGPSATNTDGQVTTTGASVPALTQFVSLVCPLLNQQGGADGPRRFARAAGVDLSQVDLSRAEGQVVSYVVGGRAKGGAKVPSLWIDKERFAPLRVIVKVGTALQEARMIDYSSAISGESHPRIVELYRGEELVGRFNTDSLNPNAKP